MPAGKVVIEGDDEFRRIFEALLEGVSDLKEVGAGAANMIAERAANQAPVVSGALQADIRTFSTVKNAGIRVGRSRIPYAGPVVGGHGAPGATRLWGGFMRPNPFIWDAADIRAQAVVDNYFFFIDELTSGRRPKAAKRYRLHNFE